MTLLRAPLSLRPGTSMLQFAALPQSARPIRPTACATTPTPSSRRYVGQGGFLKRPDFYEEAKAEGLKPREYRASLQSEKHILLSGLPTTATPADIRALARQSKTANDIGRIEYIYLQSMAPSGRAIVSFSSHIRAHAFEADAHGRIVGGKMLNARICNVKQRDRLLLQTYGSWPAGYQLPFDLIEYENGKLVLLRNVPKDTTEARLEERLASRYDLRPQDRWRGKRSSVAGYLLDRKGYGGSHDAVLGGVLKLPRQHTDSTTSNFIVRCQTQSEAMRLVRRWHNTYFAPATFDIQDTGGRYRVSASILY